MGTTNIRSQQSLACASARATFSELFNRTGRRRNAVSPRIGLKNGLFPEFFPCFPVLRVAFLQASLLIIQSPMRTDN
jgi:hypothetical protein